MNDFYTVTEYAKRLGKDPGNIRRMLIAGKITGEKIGRQWLIPKETEYPKDQRVKSGNYRNWRKSGEVRKTNPELMKSLNDMCNKFETIYGELLDKIVLYGSYARGEETRESDVDIAVILKEQFSDAMHDKMIDVVVDCELEQGVTFSVITVELDNYNEWSSTLPFYINLAKEGIILWRAA